MVVPVLRLRREGRDVGLVLASFVVLLVVENLAIEHGYRTEFVGTWEIGSARTNVAPIALALSLPVAISIVALARLARAGRAVGVAIVFGIGGAALGVGLSTGRHLANLAIRIPFVIVSALVGGLVAWGLARSLPRARPSVVATLGVAVAVLAWLTDAFVLRRLYPAFHLALYFLTLFAWSSLSLVPPRRSWVTSAVALTGIVMACGAVAWAPRASARLRDHDNVRRIFLERAPLLGRAVVIASQMSPPPPLEEDDASTSTLMNLRDRSGAPALDWRGHDIVLVTIDALRADHLSSYGYGRRTTPNIDALAEKGARFENAYCPTPHTSYSIASMMTGKYMKPLLALGPQDETETWPVQLQRYGYRTAAFYPPAVFFIDEHRFRRLRDQNLGFEYKKEEFADPELRRAQIARYLSVAPRDRPVFLWVHLFEPHEPYEMHPAHPFSGEPRVDAYDSEIAEADVLVGDLVKLVGERRPPGTVFIVSADHGEEHGDHGGRYHGTTVYEEQVRVPLVVVGPGVVPHVVSSPVQTIDLLPTTLAALDVPIPPRLRGRDLGRALAFAEAANEEGLAFAETDDYTLVARGKDRLVCARKIGSCALYDVSLDRAEKKPLTDHEPRIAELRRLTAAIERETGKIEASTLPEALRRGLQGDRDAAGDIAPLLDDARPDIRRIAARCAFKLHVPEMTPQLQRTFSRDEDAEVQHWTAMALVRGGVGRGERSTNGERGPESVAHALLESGTAEERVAAALAFAEQGDGRGEAQLVERWTAAFGPDARTPGELDEARALLTAFVRLRSKAAVVPIVRSLDDVRLRPHLVEALGELGDGRAKEPLLRAFASERYLHLRPLEAKALVKLGARSELLAPLARFAGTPEPMAEAIRFARDAKLLTPNHGGTEWSGDARGERARVRFAEAGAARLLVMADATASGAVLTGSIARSPLPERVAYANDVYIVEVGVIPAGDIEVDVRLSTHAAVKALWLVPLTNEIPPPPPRAWDAGATPDEPLP